MTNEQAYDLMRQGGVQVIPVDFDRVRFTKEELDNLEHALINLHGNRIIEDDFSGGWYIGSKSKFKKRHRASIKMLQKWLKENG